MSTSVKGGKRLDEAKAAQDGSVFVLYLYVAGATPISEAAVANIKRICAAHLAGRFELQVVDLHQHPDEAQANDLLATPTLVKTLPLPMRKIIGALSDEAHVLAALGLEQSKAG